MFAISRRKIRHCRISPGCERNKNIIMMPKRGCRWSVRDLLKGSLESSETITTEKLQHLAKLSRLSPTPEKLEQLRRDIERTLVFVGHIQKVDTTGVAPLQNLQEDHPLQRRKDLPRSSANPEESQQEVLANTKVHYRSYFAVPKTPGHDDEWEETVQSFWVPMLHLLLVYIHPGKAFLESRKWNHPKSNIHIESRETAAREIALDNTCEVVACGSIGAGNMARGTLAGRLWK